MAPAGAERSGVLERGGWIFRGVEEIFRVTGVTWVVDEVVGVIENGRACRGDTGVLGCA